MSALLSRLLFFLVVIICVGCASAPPPRPSAAVANVIVADAPQGFTLRELGVPLDAEFRPMIGNGAGSMFAQQPVCARMGTWASDRRLVENEQELKANLRAWFLNFDVGSQWGQQYGYQRAVQLTNVCQIPLGASMSQAPVGATYFASKVFFGHSYTIILRGNSRAFNAGVGAEFKIFGGSANAFASRHHLQVFGSGRGLQPVGDAALFADPRDIAQNYRAIKAEPDAVVVEYTQIPNTFVNTTPTVPERVVEIRFTNLQVQATGSAIYDYSNWRMSALCSVNGAPVGQPSQFVAQRVSVGSYPLMFSTLIHARDSDLVECQAWGTYTRWDSAHNLGPGSTGPIVVEQLSRGPTVRQFNGRDAKAGYTITWTMVKLR